MNSATPEFLRAGLAVTLAQTALDEPSAAFPQGLGEKQTGKVRDNYCRGALRFLVATDRISAFDQVLGTLPFKGQILNQVSAWWFQKTESVAPNHLLATPDPAVTVAVECRPFPVEFVVRAYLTGVTDTSIWTAYARGDREFCGHQLPDGLRQYEPLTEPILTPSTKATTGHDESVSKAVLLERGAISENDFAEAEALVLRLFKAGQAHCHERGLILVDSKYELGRDATGAIRVIDEVHTPDSSRYWFTASYEARLRQAKAPESFDKEYVRRWLREQGYRGDGPPPALPDDVRIEAASRYLQACEAITGQAPTLDAQPPEARIRENLRRYLEASERS